MERHRQPLERQPHTREPQWRVRASEVMGEPAGSSS
jgi:hypothetical protein